FRILGAGFTWACPAAWTAWTSARMAERSTFVITRQPTVWSAVSFTPLSETAMGRYGSAPPAASPGWRPNRTGAGQRPHSDQFPPRRRGSLARFRIGSDSACWSEVEAESESTPHRIRGSQFRVKRGALNYQYILEGADREWSVS